MKGRSTGYAGQAVFRFVGCMEESYSKASGLSALLYCISEDSRGIPGVHPTLALHLHQKAFETSISYADKKYNRPIVPNGAGAVGAGGSTVPLISWLSPFSNAQVPSLSVMSVLRGSERKEGGRTPDSKRRARANAASPTPEDVLRQKTLMILQRY